MTFRVGQKVVCVDDSIHDFSGKKWIEDGQIYTVRWVGLGSNGFQSKHPCVRLTGVVRDYGNDMPFRVTRFRPVVERKTETGMAILKKLLKAKSKELCGND